MWERIHWAFSIRVLSKEKERLCSRTKPPPFQALSSGLGLGSAVHKSFSERVLFSMKSGSESSSDVTLITSTCGFWGLLLWDFNYFGWSCLLVLRSSICLSKVTFSKNYEAKVQHLCRFCVLVSNKLKSSAEMFRKETSFLFSAHTLCFSAKWGQYIGQGSINIVIYCGIAGHWNETGWSLWSSREMHKSTEFHPITGERVQDNTREGWLGLFVRPVVLLIMEKMEQWG